MRRRIAPQTCDPNIVRSGTGAEGRADRLLVDDRRLEAEALEEDVEHLGALAAREEIGEHQHHARAAHRRLREPAAVGATLADDRRAPDGLERRSHLLHRSAAVTAPEVEPRAPQRVEEAPLIRRRRGRRRRRRAARRGLRSLLRLRRRRRRHRRVASAASAATALGRLLRRPRARRGRRAAGAGELGAHLVVARGERRHLVLLLLRGEARGAELGLGLRLLLELGAELLARALELLLEAAQPLAQPPLDERVGVVRLAVVVRVVALVALERPARREALAALRPRAHVRARAVDDGRRRPASWC